MEITLLPTLNIRRNNYEYSRPFLHAATTTKTQFDPGLPAGPLALHQIKPMHGQQEI